MAEYELDEVEQKRFDAFRKSHKKCKPNKGLEVGLPYSFIFTPTGIVTTVKVVCPYCGKTKDITNVDCW